MFGKPKALIQIQRQTGAEEHITVTVNASKCTRKAIYNAIVEAGDALQLRLVKNNELAVKALDNKKEPVELRTVPKHQAFDPTRKKGKK